MLAEIESMRQQKRHNHKNKRKKAPSEHVNPDKDREESLDVNIDNLSENEKKEAKRLRKLLKKQKKSEAESLNLVFQSINGGENLHNNECNKKKRKRKKIDEEEKPSLEEIVNEDKKEAKRLRKLLKKQDIFSNTEIVNQSFDADEIKPNKNKKKKEKISALKEETAPPELKSDLDDMPVCDIILNTCYKPVPKKHGSKRKQNEETLQDKDSEIANEDLNEITFVGEEGPGVDAHQKTPEGVRLSFKCKTVTNHMPNWLRNKNGPHSSYKHLIKSDIIVGFKNTNLHEIGGYAVRKINIC